MRLLIHFLKSLDSSLAIALGLRGKKIPKFKSIDIKRCADHVHSNYPNINKSMSSLSKCNQKMRSRIKEKVRKKDYISKIAF